MPFTRRNEYEMNGWISVDAKSDHWSIKASSLGSPVRRPEFGARDATVRMSVRTLESRV